MARIRTLMTVGVAALAIVSAACTGWNPFRSAPAPTTGTITAVPEPTTSARSKADFGISEVLQSSAGRDGVVFPVPFTTGVLRPDDPFRDDSSLSERPASARGELVTYADLDDDGSYDPTIDEKFVLAPPVVTGANVVQANAVETPNGAWAVDIKLDAAGTEALRILTQRILLQRAAMTLDRVVIIAPTVQGVITRGLVQVTAPRREALRIAAELHPLN
jgi:preprotein translocase subunit SecD